MAKQALTISPKSRNFLIIERPENWAVDQAENFCRFGLPASRKKRAEVLQPGDRIFTYVSGGISCFADLREVTEPGCKPLRHGGSYDSGYGYQIATRPLLVLSEPRWVHIQWLRPQLNFLAHLTDWRQAMRSNIRPLSLNDAEVIEGALVRASKFGEDQA